MILLNCTSVDGVLMSVSTGSSENSRSAETETITQDETPVESETPAQTVQPIENISTATNETPVITPNTERVEEYEVVPTNHSHEAGLDYFTVKSDQFIIFLHFYINLLYNCNKVS